MLRQFLLFPSLGDDRGLPAGKETLAERDKCVLYSFYQHSGETVMVKILFVCHGNI